MVKEEKQFNKLVQNRSFWYFLFLILYLIPLAIALRSKFEGTWHFLGRISALIGITSLFIAILLSLLVKESKRIFGVYYLKIHHTFSFLGLLLISLHPVFLAIDFGTGSIFIPTFSSWYDFLKNAGRPALYLIYIAVMAALLRKSMAKHWKYVHSLLYPAFILGAVHSILNGRDLKIPILSLLFMTEIIIVIIIFCYKRYRNKKSV